MADLNDAPFEAYEEEAEETEEELACRSHLVVDIGHSYTTITLYESVDGSYRLSARGSSLTTARSPWFDINQGIRAAANQITQSTGRILLNPNGFLISPTRLDGTGVDCLGLTVSAADPLRAIIIGLLEDVSLASARKALRTIYGLEIDRFSLTDSRSEHKKLESILRSKADIALIVGGSDGASDTRLLELVDTVSIGLNLLDDFQRPRVIYAGNRDLRSLVTEKLSGLTDVYMAENIQPSVDVEQLDSLIDHLATAYGRYKIGELPGIEGIRDLCSMAVLPTSHTFGGIIEYFAALHGGLVAGLDIGSGSVSLVTAEAGRVNLTIRSDLGLGPPIVNALKNEGFSDIFSWTDGQTRADDVRDFIYNKSLMPHTVPQNIKEMNLEYAVTHLLVKEIVSEATGDPSFNMKGSLRPSKLLLLRGKILTEAPNLGHPILAVIDGLQPTGIFRIVLDEYDVLPAMGLMATHNPKLVVQVLDSGVLKDVGWVIVADGLSELGRPVLRISLAKAGSEMIRRDVKYGSLHVIALAPEQQAELTVQPARNIDVGAGLGKPVKQIVNGGLLGLIFDARGRPLEIKGDDVTKRSQRQQWLKAIGS